MNEGFVIGKKHFLRTIQRRKSSKQSQLVGTSSKAVLEGELENLRKDRSLMMQELTELHHQQRCTFEQVEVCNEKLEAAEQRQKQMVSFLAKMFHNPKFIQNMKETKTITYPRTKRKPEQDHTQEMHTTPYLSPKRLAKEHANLDNYEAIDKQQHNPFLDDSDNLGFGDEMEMVNESQEQAEGEPSGINLVSFPDDWVVQNSLMQFLKMKV